MNDLQKLIDKYPRKPWSGLGLTCNPNITPEFMLKHPQISWDYISFNPNLTRDQVLELYSDFKNDRPNKFFDIFPKVNKCYWLETLVYSDSITWSDAQEIINYIAQQYFKSPQLSSVTSTISARKYITLDIVKSNPNFPWDWDELSGNLNIKLEDIIQSVLSNELNNWDYIIICSREDVDLECFELLLSWNMNDWLDNPNHFSKARFSSEKIIHFLETWPHYWNKIIPSSIYGMSYYKAFWLFERLNLGKQDIIMIYNCNRIINKILSPNNSEQDKQRIKELIATIYSGIYSNPKQSIEWIIEKYSLGRVSCVNGLDIFSNPNLTLEDINEHDCNWSSLSSNKFDYCQGSLRDLKNQADKRNTLTQLLNYIPVKDIVHLVLDYVYVI